jgi:hypothetical protein
VSVNAQFDKEAYTGIPGRMCRYAGEAATGLSVDLAPGDVLTVTPEQVRVIFSELGSFNRLLEECLGSRPTVGFIERVKAEARARRARRATRVPRDLPRRPFDHLVSPRFRQWLEQHSATVFGRPLGAEAALLIQAVFGGEGLLPMNMDRPGDFPVADAATSLRGLTGRRVIYEEGREFMAVDVRAVTTTGEGEEQLHVSLHNLHLPGFATTFPDDFSVGGQAGQISIGEGTAAAYMGIWAMITGPVAVEKIVAAASSGLNRKALLKVCRDMTRASSGNTY